MVTFRVPDMTCGHCASAIAKAVAGVDKSARVEVNVPEKLVAVISTAAESDLLEAVRQAGYTPDNAAVAPDRPNGSSGCCCSRRKAVAVDADQAEVVAAGTCCH